MLAKLLKYDFAALSRVLVPVHVAAVLVGFAAAACFLLIGPVEGFYSSYGTSNPLAYALMPLGGMCLFALGAAPVATFVVIVRRWYANLLTDEGYLTLTLPVSANAQVASKTIAGFVWMMVDLVVVFLLLVLSATIMTGSLTSLFWSLGGPYDLAFSFANNVLSIVAGTAQVLLALLMAYAAFTLGSVLAARHRVAAGVGLFLGISWLVGSVSAVVSTFFSFARYEAYGVYSSLYGLASTTLALVCSLAAAAALYALCVHLLKTKVDLP